MNTRKHPAFIKKDANGYNPQYSIIFKATPPGTYTLVENEKHSPTFPDNFIFPADIKFSDPIQQNPLKPNQKLEQFELVINLGDDILHIPFAETEDGHIGLNLQSGSDVITAELNSLKNWIGNGLDQHFTIGTPKGFIKLTGTLNEALQHHIPINKKILLDEVEEQLTKLFLMQILDQLTMMTYMAEERNMIPPLNMLGDLFGQLQTEPSTEKKDTDDLGLGFSSNEFESELDSESAKDSDDVKLDLSFTESETDLDSELEAALDSELEADSDDLELDKFFKEPEPKPEAEPNDLEMAKSKFGKGSNTAKKITALQQNSLFVRSLQTEQEQRQARELIYTAPRMGR